jgi:hypothetical protein
MMLRKLISCDGAKELEDLLLLLENEIKNGRSLVPKWYKFEAARQRGFGYQACSARSCCSTETVEKMFGYCSGCRVSFYCSKECQTKDWKERHKLVCIEARNAGEKQSSVRQFLDALNDPDTLTALRKQGF